MPSAPPLSAVTALPAGSREPTPVTVASGDAGDMSHAGVAAVGHTSVAKLLSELTKARLTAMVLVTTAVGCIAASPHAIAWGVLAVTIVGTAFAAASASILNQIFEIDRDAQMRRTRTRPLPSGRIGTTAALTLALFSGWIGVMILGLWTTPLAAGLALLNILLYAFVYTPLKTRTTLNTLVGAVTGAIPPMIGWVAVTGSLDIGAWVLGAILFVWQLPHFLALAWLYRDDYRAGGFVMLPSRDPRGALTAEVTLLTSLLLVPIGLLAFLTGLAGSVYAIGSTILAAGMVGLAIALARRPSDVGARRVFLASIVYLPLLLVLMVVDRGPVLQPVAQVDDMPVAAPITGFGTTSSTGTTTAAANGVGIRP